LQPMHDNAKFSSLFEPPLTDGIMCSTEYGEDENNMEQRQYSHRESARLVISAFSFAEILVLFDTRRSYTQLLHHALQRFPTQFS